MEYCTRYGKRHDVRNTEVVGESLTRQAFKDECDINNLMKKYIRTGALPVGIGNGSYGDFSSAGDFQEAQLVLKTAQAQFEALPSAVRARFRNSPAEFLTFVANKDNYEEARELGLLSAEAKAEVKNSVVPPVVNG